MTLKVEVGACMTKIILWSLVHNFRNYCKGLIGMMVCKDHL
jgi:hypothetical protein